MKNADPPSGRSAYADDGEGPVARFVNGVFLNSHFWRYSLAAISDIRKCVAQIFAAEYRDLIRSLVLTR